MTAFHSDDDTTCYLLRIILDRYLAALDGRVLLLTVWQTALEDRVECLNDIRVWCTRES